MKSSLPNEKSNLLEQGGVLNTVPYDYSKQRPRIVDHGLIYRHVEQTRTARARPHRVPPQQVAA